MSLPAKLQAVPEDWETALAVVAHPDDLEFGAASAIAKWTSEGKEIRYLLITKGEAGIDGMAPEEAGPLRAAEERASAAVVGVTEVEFLGHPDGMVEYGLLLRRDIARAVRRHKPQVIISINPHRTWGGSSWNTPDHQAVGEAVVDGARDAANRWVFRELLEEGLEPWQGVRFVIFHGSPRATHGVDVAAHVAVGLQSLLCHKAYLDGLGNGFDAGEFIRSTAESDGKLLGCEVAAGFELVPL